MKHLTTVTIAIVTIYITVMLYPLTCNLRLLTCTVLIQKNSAMCTCVFSAYTELAEVLWSMVLNRAISKAAGDAGFGVVAVFGLWAFWAGQCCL